MTGRGLGASASRAPSAALVVVGDEILSGKVADTNSGYLIGALRERGIDLRKILVVADELEDIAWAIRHCVDAYDHVFTSGGIGPTHDDVTSAGVALALGRSLVRNPELDELLRGFFGSRLTEDHLKMADVPEGTSLMLGGEIRWPVIVPAPGLYMLPGIPEIFRAKVDALRGELDGVVVRCSWVHTSVDEGLLAPHLNAILETHPAVKIGSYPVLGRQDYRVRVAIESTDDAAVDAAVDELLRRLPAGEAARAPIEN